MSDAPIESSKRGLEPDMAVVRARWERHLRRERRQDWFDWSNHLFFGFRDMLLLAGAWTLANILLIVATPIDASAVFAFGLDFHLSVMLGVFALAWAVLVANRWLQERRRIIARHRRILAPFESNTDSS
jgi:hypothetical protein